MIYNFTNSTMILYKETLFNALYKFSYKKGNFILSSGKESDFFIDCKQYLLSSSGHYFVSALFYDMCKNYKYVKAIAGVELGGCSLASGVSLYSFSGPNSNNTLNAIYVRKNVKEHGSSRKLEGNDIVPIGSEVIILEDVITTGASTIKAINVLKESGYNVVAVFVVVDREEGGTEEIEKHGVKVYSLFNKSDFLKVG